jgi:hypothetical protein
MGTGYIPDAVLHDRLDQFRMEFSTYIEKNRDSIMGNLPLFYHKVASHLESAGLAIPDPLYDGFIDAVTLNLLTGGLEAHDPMVIRRVCERALEVRRDKDKSEDLHLAAAVALMRDGKFLEAAGYMKPFRTHDIQIGCWHAYCYYRLYKEGSNEAGYIPGKRWNYLKTSRRLIGELGQSGPSLRPLLSGELSSLSWLTEAFWTMLFYAVEWLPEDRYFLKIGIKRAKLEKNEVVLARLLQIALVRFPRELIFFREAYLRNFEEGELDGAVALVREMEKQHPHELEPVYLGLRASFFAPDGDLFTEFRINAGKKQMPVHILQMVDFGHAYLKGWEDQAELCLHAFQGTFPEYLFFSQLLDYLAFREPVSRKKDRAAVFQAVDQFCMRMLNISPL